MDILQCELVEQHLLINEQIHCLRIGMEHFANFSAIFNALDKMYHLQATDQLEACMPLLEQDEQLMRLIGVNPTTESLVETAKKIAGSFIKFFQWLGEKIVHLFDNVFDLNVRYRNILNDLKVNKLNRGGFNKEKFANTQIVGYERKVAEDLLGHMYDVDRGLHILASDPLSIGKINVQKAFASHIAPFGWQLQGQVLTKTEPTIERRSGTLRELRWNVDLVKPFAEQVIRFINNGLQAKNDLASVKRQIELGISTAQKMQSEAKDQTEIRQLAELVEAEKNGLIFYTTMVKQVYYEANGLLARQTINMIKAL